MADKQIVVDVANDITKKPSGERNGYDVKDFLTGSDLADYKAQKDARGQKRYLEDFVDGKDLVLKLPNGKEKIYPAIAIEQAVKKQFRELESNPNDGIMASIEGKMAANILANNRKMALIEELVDHARSGNVFKTAEGLVDSKIEHHLPARLNANHNNFVYYADPKYIEQGLLPSPTTPPKDASVGRKATPPSP
ncbi:MAG: hypothetical protein AABY33_05985 [Pseudomonadota bacterium]